MNCPIVFTLKWFYTKKNDDDDDGVGDDDDDDEPNSALHRHMQYASYITVSVTLSMDI